MKLSFGKSKTATADEDKPAAVAEAESKKPSRFSFARAKKSPTDNTTEGQEKPATKKESGAKAKRHLGPKQRGKKVAVGVRSARFVLLVGDEGAILVLMQGKKLERRLFAPSAQKDHTAGIVELMRNHPKVPVYLLADVLDQQYVRQNFPPVSAFSVQGLVKRRLERDFQPGDLTGFLPLGREKQGRKEWNFMLIALANTPQMQQWMELISELPNECRGVYLSPVEAQNYIPLLKQSMPRATPAMPWQLLVTHHKVSGFRQVVLRDGKLVFSRVTQAIDDAIAAVVAGNIEQEILSTLEYLRRLGFQENNTLELIVIASSEVKESIDVNRFGVSSAVVLTPLDVADAVKLEQAALSADRFGDVVMAACFAQVRKPVLKFQTAYMGKLSQLYLAKRAALGLVALICFGLLAGSVGSIAAAISDRAAISKAEQQRGPARAELSSFESKVAKIDVDVAKKSAIVAAYDLFLKQAVDPLQFVRDLTYNTSKNERILEIAWGPKASAAGNNPAAAGSMSAAETEIKLSVEFVAPFEDVDGLAKAVDQYVTNLRSNMPNYTIATGALPWLSQSSSQGLEISFDKKGAEALKDGITKIDIFFWPKPATPDAQNAGAAPPPPPPAGMAP